MDEVEADIDDPGPYEGTPANPQHIVADGWPIHNCRPPEFRVGVHPDQNDHGQTQQEEEEQAEVETLSHQGRLVQDFLLSILQ